MIIPFMIAWLNSGHWQEMDREIKQNDSLHAPSSHQLRWHIRHIRQDMALTAKLLMLLIKLQALMLAVMIGVCAKMFS